MIIAKECIESCVASIALKNTVGVEATDNCGCRGVWACRWRLAPDTEQIGEQVPVDQVGGVGEKSCKIVAHVEPYVYSERVSDGLWNADAKYYSPSCTASII